MTLAELNALPPAAFRDRLAAIFEHSPWVAGRAAPRRPFASLEALHAALREEVERAAPAEQLALLRAHPDLGARAALTAASQSEQSSAGLLALDAGRLEILQSLTACYRRKFGFPFIYAVKGSPPEDILISLQIRLDGAPEEEFHAALSQIYRIAWFRLSAMLEGA
jgi:2-oxo-4-hydroxy-4-carboxy-5-ureidoimidazoline decarboxylase